MIRVLVADKMSPRAASVFRMRGIEVDEYDYIDQKNLINIIGEYDGIAIRSLTKITPKVLSKANKLKVIGRAGIGIDNIDLNSATSKGVVVMNTPFGNSITTAEHTIAMLLSLARKIPEADRLTRSGGWGKNHFLGVEIANKVLGLIGCGNIGSIVADRAQGLKMRVLAFDPFLSNQRAKDLGVEKVDFDNLLSRSDFISLHVPLNEQTEEMINAETLSKSKDGIRIINCARGGLINEADLLESIKNGNVAGAALDVFKNEPTYESELFSLPQVIATPHLGASTSEAQENVAAQIAEQMCDYILLGTVINALNMPSISTEDAPKILPYIQLSRQLGSFLGQIIETGIKAIRIEYEGHLATLNTRPITAILLEGLLSPLLDSVNMVNAPLLARERDIDVTEIFNERIGDYPSLLRITITTDQQTHSIAGTLFTNAKPRIIQVDGINIEAEMAENMLFLVNEDKPGFIGNLGTILGDSGVNIATFHLGRISAGSTAITLIETDQEVSATILEDLLKIPLVKRAKSLRFYDTNRPNFLTS